MRQIGSASIVEEVTAQGRSEICHSASLKRSYGASDTATCHLQIAVEHSISLSPYHMLSQSFVGSYFFSVQRFGNNDNDTWSSYNKHRYDSLPQWDETGMYMPRPAQ